MDIGSITNANFVAQAQKNKADYKSFKGNEAKTPILELQNNINNTINPNIPISYTKIASAKTPFSNDNVNLYMLSNGQRVAVVKKEGTTIVKSFVNVGAINEDEDVKGISHFIEHNLFNGSENYEAGAVFTNAAKMGANYNASTSLNKTDYYISSSIMNEVELQEVIKMQSDMIYRPKFSDEMIEKEKGPVTSEISMLSDNYMGKMYNEVIKNLYGIKSNTADLIGGDIKTINQMDRQKVLDYWSKYYTPDNVITVVVGDVDEEKTMDLIAKNFNAKANIDAIKTRKIPKLEPLQHSKRIDYVSPKDNSSAVIVGFAGPSATSCKEDFSCLLLSRILTEFDTSRLSAPLKNIDVYCAFDKDSITNNPNDSSPVFAVFDGPRGSEQKALDIFYNVINDLKRNPITQEELDIIKKALLKDMAESFEGSNHICNTLGAAIHENNLQNVEKWQEIINSITVNDIQNAAKKYYDLNKASIGVLHAKGTSISDIQNSYFKSGYSNKIKNNEISFTGAKNISTQNVKQYTMSDNTHVIIDNSKSDLCYFSWDLISYDNVPKNLAVPYVLTEILNNDSMFLNSSEYINRNAKKGIYNDFYSNGFMISMYCDCLKDDAKDAINILKEGVFYPRFTQEEFERARKKIATYVNSLNKDTSSVLISQLYPDYFASAKEILEGLNKMTLDDVKAHWEGMMKNSSSTFTAVIPQDIQDNVMRTLVTGQKFKDKTPHLEKVYKPIEKTKIIYQSEERNQASILQTNSFKLSGNIKDEVKLEILNTILGGCSTSRLFNDLRESKKLAYAVGSEIQSFGDTGIITCFIKTTTDDKAQNDIKYDNLQKSIDGFNENIALLKTNYVTDDELQTAKKLLKQELSKEFELSASRLGLLATNATLPCGIKRIDEYYKTIDEITKEDVMSAAKYAFNDKPVISILASKDTIDNQMPYLKNFANS